MSPPPKTGAPLSSEDVGLLVAGDVLRCIKGSDEYPAIATGKTVSFIRPSGSGGVSNCIVTSQNDSFGYRPTRFTFIGRPDADGWIPAPQGGWGENPVPGMRIGVRFADGSEPDWSGSGLWEWRHEPDRRKPSGGDIIAIRLPDHISSAGEKVEPANGEVAGGKLTYDGDDMVAVANSLHEWLKNYPPSTRHERAIEAANRALTTFCLRKQLSALRAQPNGGAK